MKRMASRTHGCLIDVRLWDLGKQGDGMVTCPPSSRHQKKALIGQFNRKRKWPPI